MTQFVQQYEPLRWLALLSFIAAAAIVTTRLAAPAPTLASDQESDAAHLMMCLVMLAMIGFPTAIDPHAMNGILTAMTVVYALLLVARIIQWRAPAPAARITPFAYHLTAAAAMLYAMSGHTDGHHGGAPAAPMLALATLFTIDAAAMALPISRSALRHIVPHHVGSAGPATVVPHVVMDLGTAYMLIAAVG
ncbi:DUF5134 domain-containing protein [Nocardia otitidiscaviarum]|uniref:DUF5134 domain-containing protein n=1 Tax=Nocardia otitidiscaviarum TaxID=1823 RepID=UPI00189342EB|nr:DUF5134 domain-containing protein [Nocardia otitidiscaviarum]MBF6241842.1 DUF5134 domain-containing protein [Nocardia otitidiscaviarum]